MVLVAFHIIIEPIKQPGLSQQSICLLYTELTQKSTKNFYIILFLSKDRVKHHRKSETLSIILRWKDELMLQNHFGIADKEHCMVSELSQSFNK